MTASLRIDIVVYQARTKKDALPEASIAAVREWAKGVGMQNSESLTVLTAGGATPRAFATVRGDRRDVFVGFFYFKKSFVVAAGTAPSDNRDGFMRVERMLWASKPHKRLDELACCPGGSRVHILPARHHFARRHPSTTRTTPTTPTTAPM